MSVFPKISLRPEVENYLKEGFMNKEVGEKRVFDMNKVNVLKVKCRKEEETCVPVRNGTAEENPK
jgi:hypothetical protein